MTRNIIIFGDSRQDGYFLKSQFNDFNLISFKSPNHPGGIDVRNQDDVRSIILKYRPSHIINLAAISETSHDLFDEIYSTIYDGNKNILQTIFDEKIDCKYVSASSAYIYESNEDLITLSSKYRFDNPYSLARINSLNCIRYFASKGVNTLCAHLFHHESKYRSPRSLIFQIAEEMLNVKSRKINTLYVKNKEVIKEWTHASDSMNALSILTLADSPGEVNIATGIGLSLHQIVQILADLLEIKPPSLRSIEKNVSPIKYIGDPKVIYEIGWRPKISAYEVCAEVLEHLKHNKLPMK